MPSRRRTDTRMRRQRIGGEPPEASKETQRQKERGEEKTETGTSKRGAYYHSRPGDSKQRGLRSSRGRDPPPQETPWIATSTPPVRLPFPGKRKKQPTGCPAAGTLIQPLGGPPRDWGPPRERKDWGQGADEEETESTFLLLSCCCCCCWYCCCSWLSCCCCCWLQLQP